MVHINSNSYQQRVMQRQDKKTKQKQFKLIVVGRGNNYKIFIQIIVTMQREATESHAVVDEHERKKIYSIGAGR